jgi:hypothetical protein
VPGVKALAGKVREGFLTHGARKGNDFSDVHICMIPSWL